MGITYSFLIAFEIFARIFMYGAIVILASKAIKALDIYIKKNS